MRIVIIGSTGQLGTELLKTFSDLDPAGLSHAEFEIESPDAIANMIADHRPQLVINTAAFHIVDRCEEEPHRAIAVNAVAVDRLSAACAEADVAFAQISTDYVFDGAKRTPYVETDETIPLNAYGISKLAGELLVRKRLAPHYIFRTSGLYALRGVSAKGKPFIERMLEAAEDRRPLRIVNDLWCSPSYASHVARAIRQIVEREAYGLYHVTNSGECTWHAFASEILRQAGYDWPIEATRAADNPSHLRRPFFSALEGRAMAALDLPPMPSWQEGIAAYLSGRPQRR